MFRVKNIRSDINIPRAIKRIDNDAFWKYAASEWHRLYYDFVPYRDGLLSTNVTILPKKIVHEEDYAPIVYKRNANFRKDQHPLATKEWDKVAAPIKKGELIRSLKDYIKARGLDGG